jgi:hypothetical protein
MFMDGDITVISYTFYPMNNMKGRSKNERLFLLRM